MTGHDVVRQALALLNYTDTRADGSVPGGDGLNKRTLAFVNQIAAELWYRDNTAPYRPLTDLSAYVLLDDVTARTVLPYGVAMLIAQSDGDANNQTLYASLYDGRRVATRTGDRIRDALPTTE